MGLALRRTETEALAGSATMQIPLPRSGLTVPLFAIGPPVEPPPLMTRRDLDQLRLTYTVRLARCRRCDESVELARDATPEEDIERASNHDCSSKLTDAS